MKTKGLRILIVTLLFTFLAGATALAAGVLKTTESYLKLEEDVYMPSKMKKDQKYPVVFMAHNGGEDKSAWGDFPEDIAKAGFIAVNLTWKAWDTSNVESAISYTLEQYKDQIDQDKVVFLGACHGGTDFLGILNNPTDAYTVKTAVLLSVSESDDSITKSQEKGHVPMLVYYSLNDEIGEPYASVAQKFATEVVTKPCKVVSQEDPAHGDGMVRKSSNKEEVRKEIISWIKKYTK